jgi:sugar phosphate isomerase/epimerase
MYKAFSSSLLGFRDRLLKDDVVLAVNNGYEGINFNIIDDFNAAPDPVKLKDLLLKNGLKPGGFGLPVDYRNSKEKYDADMKKLPGYCKYAQAIGMDRCITWIVASHDTLDYKANYQLHKERLTPAAKLLEDHGIRFGIEFVGPVTERRARKYEFIHNLDTLMELLHDINTSNMGILMDAWHWDMAGQTYADFKKIPDNRWVVMVHINDAPTGIPPEEQKDLVRELPGATGVIKISDFFKGLADLNYDGPVYVEPFNEPLKKMPIEEAVKTAKAAMDKVWPK